MKPRYEITNLQRAIVASHYQLQRPVSEGEVRAEIDNLIRRRDTGLGWFDMDAALAVRLNIPA